jgi:hypothetical protein
MRFVALLLVITVGCGGGATWSRHVTIGRTSHVALVLDTDAAKACYQACLASTPPSTCLERCDGATVIPGECADDARACFVRKTSSHLRLDGRCRDPVELAPGESVVSCVESSTPKPTGIGGFELIAGAALLAGALFLGFYVWIVTTKSDEDT